jgi:hypothetical protein
VAKVTARLDERRRRVLDHATREGLVGRDKDGRVTARVSKTLLTAAKRRAGTRSDTELVEYALARVALEDDFGDRLFHHEGTVPKSVDLEF